MNIPLEVKVIKKFFRKEKQERFIGFISSVRNRRKFLNELSHLNDLNWEMFQEVNSFSADIALQVVKSRNRAHQKCYVISEDRSLDQTELPIDRISEVTGTGYAMILIFGDADAIYYEGEPPKNRFLSS